MAQLLEDSSFCEEFIQQCPAAVEVLNLVAQECSPGERLGMVESQCERVRMLYRDCARPPPPPLQTERRQVGTGENRPLDVTRNGRRKKSRRKGILGGELELAEPVILQ